MGTLGKIRNRSGLLLAVIGFALLAFLGTEAVTALGSGNNRNNNYVGEIFGDNILTQKFEETV